MGSLGDFASNLWRGIKSVGKTVLNVAAPAVATVVDALRRGVESIQDALKREFREPPATERERIERDIEEVNERIMRLRKRYYERGHLSESDKRENEHLRRQRAELANELEALDQTMAAEDIVNDEEKYEPLQIDDALTHILQYHVGQGTFNKHCPECKRPMVLQYKRDRAVAATSEFFWSCIGYYENLRPCRYSEPLSAGDFSLFVNARRREFELKPNELSNLVLESRPVRIKTAMRDLMGRLKNKREGVEGYRCPIHKERLLLREKRSPEGLLDQFFLGCPRYDADGRGCNYLVKIKSPAQFSAVFDAAGEGGLIQVTESGSAAPPPASHGKPWTDELNSQVMRAYAENLTIAQIASIFQRTETSIYLKLQNLGKMSSEEVQIALGTLNAPGSASRIDY